MTDWREVEQEARLLTWHAWIDRDRGRLFSLPDMTAVRQKVILGSWRERNERVWRLMDDEFWGKAVGVVPPQDRLAQESGWYTDWRSACAVGVWAGLRQGFLGGVDLHVASFSGPGSTYHRSPFNIGFVHVLPQEYQSLAGRFYEDEGQDDCGMCSYRFKDDEEPCNCHLVCAGCCIGERAREAVREAA